MAEQNKKKYAIKVSNTRFIIVEGEIAYCDAEEGKKLPAFFPA